MKKEDYKKYSKAELITKIRALEKGEAGIYNKIVAKTEKGTTIKPEGRVCLMLLGNFPRTKKDYERVWKSAPKKTRESWKQYIEQIRRFENQNKVWLVEEKGEFKVYRK